MIAAEVTRRFFPRGLRITTATGPTERPNFFTRAKQMRGLPAHRVLGVAVLSMALLGIIVGTLAVLFSTITDL
jgi:hypothetical protein